MYLISYLNICPEELYKEKTEIHAYLHAWKGENETVPLQSHPITMQLMGWHPISDATVPEVEALAIWSAGWQWM